jgi:UrcA family protein
MKHFKSAAALAAVVLGFGVASAAGAQTPDAEAPRLVIHYSPSSLATESGVRRLYGRLVSAAEKVCPQPQVARWASDAVIECRRQALADAVAQIHNARLADMSAAYARKG